VGGEKGVTVGVNEGGGGGGVDGYYDYWCIVKRLILIYILHTTRAIVPVVVHDGQHPAS
jgi:hypothetical protein